MFLFNKQCRTYICTVSLFFSHRAKEREKKKERTRERIARGDLRPSKKAMKKNSMEKSNCKVRVALDSSFDDYMTERVSYT